VNAARVPADEFGEALLKGSPEEEVCCALSLVVLLVVLVLEAMAVLIVDCALDEPEVEDWLELAEEEEDDDAELLLPDMVPNPVGWMS
jgi:hypothetical protein